MTFVFCLKLSKQPHYNLKDLCLEFENFFFKFLCGRIKFLYTSMAIKIIAKNPALSAGFPYTQHAASCESHGAGSLFIQRRWISIYLAALDLHLSSGAGSPQNQQRSGFKKLAFRKRPQFGGQNRQNLRFFEILKKRKMANFKSKNLCDKSLKIKNLR